MRGIIGSAVYIPHRRLTRSSIAEFFGSGGGAGTRSVSGHDEDTTTMGFEAARLAVQPTRMPELRTLLFATTSPAYVDKTNASAIHAALHLPRSVPAYDVGGALRSGIGALLLALQGQGNVVVIGADSRDGLPTGPDEAFVGDGAAALVVGSDNPDSPVLAEFVGAASVTDEIVDRWRTPGDSRSRVWEERFGEARYISLGLEAWSSALASADLTPADLSRACISGMHRRAVQSLSGKLGLKEGVLAPDFVDSIGQTGVAHPGLLLASVLEDEARQLRDGTSSPGRYIAVAHLADGADVLIFRTTTALRNWAPVRPITSQVHTGSELSYGTFLRWRGMTTVEPPRRPEPQRVSASAAWRNEGWKFGFVGSQDRSSGAIQLPPTRISMSGGVLDDMEPVLFANTPGTIVTFTVDSMAYSPSPPIIFAVVDFDGGGRFPLELTDVDPDEVSIGTRIEMTFRRLYTADGIHNYFWKARPLHESDKGGAL
jgi:3-hydroxy-3-methylglutaryl CoA synthase/uncharacterized OB-fold protein